MIAGSNSMKDTSHNDATFDFSRLHMIAETDKEKAQLIAIFFRMADRLVASMELCSKNKAFTEWKNTAHSLRGAASNLGMTALEKQCVLCEKSILEDFTNSTALLQDVRNEIEYIKNYISKHHPAFIENQARD